VLIVLESVNVECAAFLVSYAACGRLAHAQDVICGLEALLIATDANEIVEMSAFCVANEFSD
jgi:hypothetical protein